MRDDVKYLWSWEWKLEDREKEKKISAKFMEAMKENPKQFPKMLTNTCFTGRCKGFRIIEADTEEQLANLIALWWPTEDWKLEVILEGEPSLHKGVPEMEPDVTYTVTTPNNTHYFSNPRIHVG